MEHEQLLRLEDVEATIGVKKSKIYLLLKEGKFPKPIRLGSRSVRWKSSEIQKFIANLSTADQEATA